MRRRATLCTAPRLRPAGPSFNSHVRQGVVNTRIKNLRSAAGAAQESFRSSTLRMTRCLLLLHVPALRASGSIHEI
jgi:hypothetical protein